MAVVLGISAHYHDAAAALVVDGVVVAAIQEERLSRIKNDPGLPISAAFACLAEAGLEPGAIDAVAFYEEPFIKLERVMVHLLRNLPRTWRLFPRALASQLGSKIWVLDHLSEALGVPRERVVRFEHHHSHAASAFLVSPYEHAAVLVVDGVGEVHSTTLWEGRGSQLRLLASIDFPHSLGLLYAGLTAWLGFAVNEGEYKVMGLAAWGKPRFRAEFERIVQLHADGAYTLDLGCFAHMSDAELGFGPGLERILGPRRPPGKPWDLTGRRGPALRRRRRDAAGGARGGAARAGPARARGDRGGQPVPGRRRRPECPRQCSPAPRVGVLAGVRAAGRGRRGRGPGGRVARVGAARRPATRGVSIVRRSASRSTRRAPWRSRASSGCRSAASTTPRRSRHRC
jgi:hypothetical protein